MNNEFNSYEEFEMNFFPSTIEEEKESNSLNDYIDSISKQFSQEIQNIIGN